VGGVSSDARSPSPSVVHDAAAGMLVSARARPDVVWLVFLFFFFFFFFFFDYFIKANILALRCLLQSIYGTLNDKDQADDPWSFVPIFHSESTI
jgi:hypothetical protein